MPAEEAHVVVVAELPDADGRVVGSRKEKVLVDGHAGDGVFVAAELGYVVVGADVPDVDPLV